MIRPDTSAAEDRTKIDDNASVELSSNRTSLSFERTRMSADRTLMSTVRTSLSLISFGFTISELFRQMHDNGLVPHGDRDARILGGALLILGVLMLAMGLVTHSNFHKELTRRRKRLYSMRLLHSMKPYHATPTFIVAAALLLIGLGALAIIITQLR